MVDVAAGDGPRIDSPPTTAPSDATSAAAQATNEAARAAFVERMRVSACIIVRTETWVIEVPARLEEPAPGALPSRVVVDLERLADATFAMLRGVHETHVSPREALMRSSAAVAVLNAITHDLRPTPPASGSS